MVANFNFTSNLCCWKEYLSASKFWGLLPDIPEHSCILAVSWTGKCALKNRNQSVSASFRPKSLLWTSQFLCQYRYDTGLPLYTFLRHILVCPLITCLTKPRKTCFISQWSAMWLYKGMIILRLFTCLQDDHAAYRKKLMQWTTEKNLTFF